MSARGEEHAPELFPPLRGIGYTRYLGGVDHLTFTTTVGPLGGCGSLEPLDDRTTRIRHRFSIGEGFAPMSPHVAEAWRQRTQADVDHLAQLVAIRLALRGRSGR